VSELGQRLHWRSGLLRPEFVARSFSARTICARSRGLSVDYISLLAYGLARGYYSQPRRWGGPFRHGPRVVARRGIASAYVGRPRAPFSASM
jgi:hypothetical protein